MMALPATLPCCFAPLRQIKPSIQSEKDSYLMLMLVTMSVCYDADNGVDDDDGGDGGDLVTVALTIMAATAQSMMIRMMVMMMVREREKRITGPCGVQDSQNHWSE